jgi:methyltransferase (TIGR00027 family)
VARTDDDSWEITESVGATALGVAAARAADTESADPLINDPFARVFLDRVGHGVWDWYGGPELPAEVIEAEPDMPLRMRALVGYFATRTKFFDTSFIDAANAGIRQALILAAGLDARSWRLPWPDGTTVYELDQDRVLDFKLATLHDHGVEPKATRVPVAVDLRQDWPTALREAGFDPKAPSVWSIEGLLMYLPATAQELLFDRVQELAAPGSRIAVEGLGPEFAVPELRAQRRERMDRVRELMAKSGSTIEVPSTDELWYFEEREDVGDWLKRHGWDVTATPSDELMASYGRPSPEGLEEASPTHWFISAQRTDG